MFEELNALVGAIAKALEIKDAEAAKAIEEGRLGLELGVDENSHKFVTATYGGKSVRVYQGAILRPDAKPDEAARA